MSIGDREIFGPVLCIKRVKDFEEGLAVMNANEFANGSVIYTQSGYYAREFARRTHGGMVGINVGIPVPLGVFGFTGHKNSFFGDLHAMGTDGVRFFTELKSVTIALVLRGRGAGRPGVELVGRHDLDAESISLIRKEVILSESVPNLALRREASEESPSQEAETLRWCCVAA